LKRKAAGSKKRKNMRGGGACAVVKKRNNFGSHVAERGRRARGSKIIGGNRRGGDSQGGDLVRRRLHSQKNQRHKKCRVCTKKWVIGQKNPTELSVEKTGKEASAGSTRKAGGGLRGEWA